MATSRRGTYARGTVESFDDRGGYGYIIPDEPDASETRLLVHRRSLRSPSLILRSGDRVIYRKESVPRGTLAADVHYEHDETVSDKEYNEGCISEIRKDKSQGTIKALNGENIYFHLDELDNLSPPPIVGAEVSFHRINNETGVEAQDISVINNGGAAAAISREVQQAATQLLSRAILARDSKNFSAAEKLYEQGLKSSASVQLVTSYAAMQKNRNRRSDAMRIYKVGMKIFPTSVKLREDAGLLAQSAGDKKAALEFFQEGLELARKSEQFSERNFLLAIARVYSKSPLHSDQKNALDYYRKAESTPGGRERRRTELPKADLLAMNIASIRSQHHRGNVAFEFIQQAGFKVVRAQLFVDATVGADFIVEVNNSELLESYGISGGLLIRCLFKSDVSRADLESLDQYIKEAGESGLVDEQVALLVVSSLSEQLQSTLFRRIEDRSRTAGAIVPLTQSEIESDRNVMATLQKVLDRWLYRRDLYALNSPVSGRRFFGREKPLAEIRDAISNGTAAGIFGLRKVGKTSLLKEVERRASEAGDIVLYVDLLRVPADITDTRWLYWKLGTELHRLASKSGLKNIKWRIGGTYPEYLDVPDKYPIATAFDSDLTQVLSEIGRSTYSPRPKVVLMLDEIERIIPNSLGKEGFTGFFDFFSYLRGVAQESSDFVPIITGANAAIAEASQFSGKDNPVFNFFREIYLPLLQANELTLMVQTLGRGMGIRIPLETCVFIYNLTGGHPFFTRQLCSFVSEQHKSRPLTVDNAMIGNLIDRYLDVAGKDFQEVLDRFSRDYPEELDACTAIVSAGGTLPVSDIMKMTAKSNVNLRHLIGYQIVEVENDNARISIQLLERWLKKGMEKSND